MPSIISLASRSLALALFAVSQPVLAAPRGAPGNFNSTIDYLIVGGGPAGLVLAEQLTRNWDVKVVLLEAGPDPSLDPLVYSMLRLMPSTALIISTSSNLIIAPASFFQTSEYLWNFTSAPDPGLNGRAPELWQGRALGGGTAVNGMGMCRGSSSVFDEWADISGNEGLAWDSGMFDAFKATMHFQDDIHPVDQTPVNKSSFGDGPLEITSQRFQLAFDRPFVDKLTSSLDIPEIDFMSGYGIGVTEQADSIRADNRTRSYAWNTFGWLAANRPNFEVRHDAWVSKIGFHGKIANSVTYNDTLTNTIHTLHAKEIVVAAGAIGSPHLLMLSGVGPADQLEAAGIPVVLDSPQVGQNMMDHHYAQLVYQTVPEEGTAWQWQYNTTVTEEAEREYAENGGGLLGMPGGNVFGCFRLPDSVYEGLGNYHTSLPADRPDIIFEYTTAPLYLGSLANIIPNVSAITPYVSLVQPEGRGNVTLASADYRQQPVINSAYWATPEDRAAILYAYKQYRELVSSPELRPWATVELYPGANVTSDADLWAAIQASSGSFHHPVGTVAIGSVLDKNWRVKGIKGLRVIGTPAAPNIITCHTQGMAYALGYRAAVDIIREDGI